MVDTVIAANVEWKDSSGIDRCARWSWLGMFVFSSNVIPSYAFGTVRVLESTLVVLLVTRAPDMFQKKASWADMD